MVREFFYKINSLLKKIPRSNYLLLGISGFVSLVLIEGLRRSIFSWLTMDKIKTWVLGMPYNSLELVIAIVSLILLFTSPIILSETKKMSGSIILVITIFSSAIFLYIGLIQSIVEQKIVTLLVITIYILVFSLFLFAKSAFLALLKWIRISENQDKTDIAKLTFVWGVIVVIFGWLINR